jgi:hypothetical protein
MPVAIRDNDGTDEALARIDERLRDAERIRSRIHEQERKPPFWPDRRRPERGHEDGPADRTE